MSKKAIDILEIQKSLCELTTVPEQTRKKYIEILELSQEKFIKKFPTLKYKLDEITNTTLDAINRSDKLALTQIIEELTSLKSDLASDLSPEILISSGEKKTIDFLLETRSIFSKNKFARIGLPWENSINRAVLSASIKEYAKKLMINTAKATKNRDRFISVYVDNAKEYREGYAYTIHRLIANGLRCKINNQPLDVVFHATSPGILDYDYEIKTRGRKTPGSLNPALGINRVWELVRSGMIRLTYYWDRIGLRNYIEKLKKEYTNQNGIFDETKLKAAIIKSMTPYLSLDMIAILLVNQPTNVYSYKHGGLSNIFGDFGIQYTIRSTEETKYVVTISRIGDPNGFLGLIRHVMGATPFINKYTEGLTPLSWAYDVIKKQIASAWDVSRNDTFHLKLYGKKEDPNRFYDNLMNQVMN